jgi:hypothetical protein
MKKEEGREHPFQYGTIESIDPLEKVELSCCLCKKQLKNRKSLSEHAKHCKVVERKEESSMEETGFRNTIHGDNNIINTQIINIRNYGNENPKWLTSRLLYQIMSDIPGAIPKLMEKKHFNNDFPENKNLRIDNKKNINKRLQVFEDGRWKIKDSKHTFYKVIVDIYDILSDALENEGEEDGEGEGEGEGENHVHMEIRKLCQSQRFVHKLQRIRPIWNTFKESMNNQELRIDLWEELKTLLLDRQLEIEQSCED